MPISLPRAVTAAVLAACAAPPAANAQRALEGQVGRFYDDAGWTLYRLGLRRPIGGPVALAVHGSYLKREDAAPSLRRRLLRAAKGRGG